MIYDAMMMGRVSHVIVDDVGDDKVFCEEIWKEKIRNNKGKVSIRRIYMSGSTRVDKRSHRPCMPEYGSG